MDLKRIKEFMQSAFSGSVREVTEAKNFKGEAINGFDAEMCEGAPVNFDTLSKVAEAFGTKDINFSDETRTGGYCETCEYSYTIVTIRVRGLTKELP